MQGEFKELETEGLSEGREDQSQQRSEYEAGVCAKLTIWDFTQRLWEGFSAGE